LVENGIGNVHLQKKEVEEFWILLPRLPNRVRSKHHSPYHLLLR